MGGKQPIKQPPPPQKTVKEMVKEFTKSINKLRRDFQREVNKLEFNNKKIKADLERMAKKKEPRSSMRIIAQNIIKNNQYISKYQRLDAQLADVIFQSTQSNSNNRYISVGYDINGKNDEASQLQSLEQFNMEVEKQNMVSEQIRDLMDDNEMEEGTDEDADKLINEIEQKVGGGGGGKLVEKPDSNFGNFDQQLQDLK